MWVAGKVRMAVVWRGVVLCCVVWSCGLCVFMIYEADSCRRGSSRVQRAACLQTSLLPNSSKTTAF